MRPLTIRLPSGGIVAVVSGKMGRLRSPDEIVTGHTWQRFLKREILADSLIAGKIRLLRLPEQTAPRVRLQPLALVVHPADA